VLSYWITLDKMAGPKQQWKIVDGCEVQDVTIYEDKSMNDEV